MNQQQINDDYFNIGDRHMCMGFIQTVIRSIFLKIDFLFFKTKYYSSLNSEIEDVRPTMVAPKAPLSAIFYIPPTAWNTKTMRLFPLDLPRTLNNKEKKKRKKEKEKKKEKKKKKEKIFGRR